MKLDGLTKEDFAEAGAALLATIVTLTLLCLFC